MSFGQAIGSGFKRYVDFSGRSSRSECWWWYLFVIIGAVVFSVIDELTGTAVLYYVFAITTLLPLLAVGVRRLHDIDKSAWGLLMALIPIIGTIMVLIWLVRVGDVGDNRYGANPLRAQVPDASGVYEGRVQGF